MTPILLIGGFDPSGGAGVSADLRVAEYLNIPSLSIISAISLQDGIRNSSNIPISQSILEAQLDFALSNYNINYAKIGVIPDAKLADTVFSKLLERGVKIILDTPLVSTSGLVLADQTYLDFLRNNIERCFLATPNFEEYKIIGKEAFKTARALVKSYSKGLEMCDALYLNGEFSLEFKLPLIKVDGANIRGTGCSLASAITCFLAEGKPIEEAISLAKNLIHKAIIRAITFMPGVKILKF